MLDALQSPVIVATTDRLGLPDPELFFDSEVEGVVFPEVTLFVAACLSILGAYWLIRSLVSR